MVLRLKPMGKLVTSEAQVLDRTKALNGPRTQTYGESSHSKRPKCKVLHGPRTQTYGETSHSKKSK